MNSTTSPDCANCGAILQGPFCHACGQSAHLHSKLRHLLHELIEGIAHFDGRLWRTLPLLTLRPGDLSRGWREGRRVRYVAPLHLFLLAVFLLFLAPSLTGRHLSLPDSSRVVSKGEAQQMPAARGGRITFDEKTALGRQLGQLLRERLQNPEYYSYKAETLAYKLSFMVVPLAMLVLSILLAFRRGYSVYDHGVVALYEVGFFALCLAIALALPGGWTGPAVAAVALAMPIHATLHLRTAYQLNWFGAAWRSLILCLMTVLGVGALFSAVVLLSVVD